MTKDPFKVIIYFDKWGEPRFREKAKFIVTALITEPLRTLMPDPLPRGCPTRAAMVTALSIYEAAADAAQDLHSAIKDRIQKRGILAQMLKDFAPHLEATAKAANDLTILLRCGYDLRRPNTRIPSNGIPPAPIITVKDGPVSGSAVIRVQPLLRGVGSYQAESAVGNPTVDDNFKPRVISLTGSRIMLSKLEIAKLHHFRVRGVGRGGPGDWSAPVSIIVT